MSNILEKIVINKKNIIISIISLILIIFVIILISKVYAYIRDNVDVSNAIHGVIIEENVVFYRSPKESKWRDIRNFDLGEYVYVLETKIDKEGKEWYKVKAKDRVGYVLKEKVDNFKFSEENKRVLMSDVSKFNIIYKHFNNSGEYAAFLLNSNMNYAYIRIGGRGYGEEGNFYTDPNYKMFIEACEYLRLPYGFYYIDEAITTQELDEEVEFVKKILDENKSNLCVLPLVIDVENHDGEGRADEIWEERASLVSELVNKFKEKDIETLIYSNAKTANEYLYSIDSKFWIAYYTLENKIPDYWYTDTEEEAVQNLELMNKIVAWQFTETGAGKEIEKNVDASLVDNNYFKKFVK